MSTLVEPSTLDDGYSFGRQWCPICEDHRLFVSTDESPRPRCPMRAMHADLHPCGTPGCGRPCIGRACGTCIEAEHDASRAELAHELDGPPNEDWFRGDR